MNEDATITITIASEGYNIVHYLNYFKKKYLIIFVTIIRRKLLVLLLLLLRIKLLRSDSISLY